MKIFDQLQNITRKQAENSHWADSNLKCNLVYKFSAFLPAPLS